jgi:hypothetical protein
MNATYTIRYGHPELETLAEQAAKVHTALRTAGKLVAAPLIGLAFVMAPIAGLAYLIWMAVKAALKNRFVTRVALFAVAPFVALAYATAFPFVGVGALVYYGARAAVS